MNVCDLSDVCTKYQEAAKIVNLTLEGLVAQCIPGANIIDLCEFGHTVMEASAAKLYTKKVEGKQVDRGVAFPVCISVNDVVCNHSPLPTEETVGSCICPSSFVEHYSTASNGKSSFEKRWTQTKLSILF